MTDPNHARLGITSEQAAAGVNALGDAIKTAQPSGAELFGRRTDADVVAYKNSDRPGVLLCREHGDGWLGLTPVTADDLPDGGLCTWWLTTETPCGRDVLIPAPVEETHVVADNSNDPEHVDDCPGCEVGIEHATHCPTPETHNWGCGCPTDERRAPIVEQPADGSRP
ncbi:hypothetical protein ACFVIY_37860 [Streptomyces sp. NPDC127166]|uniref:hypothetical protein n=1 Tax=Streptomyces sp. NPDC127166 TaxID=3345380 RepID=UPI00363EE8D4